MGWLVLALLTATPDMRVVRIIGTSDLHCRPAPTADFGAPGLPRRLLGGWPGLLEAIADNRTEMTLVLDCGDFASGSADADSSFGRAAVRLMNEAGYDAAVPGARDFAYGAENLELFARLAAFPVLCDPMLDVVLNRRVPLFRPYAVRDVKGVRVGLVGITDPDLAELNLRDDTRGLAVEPPPAQVRRSLAALAQESVDVVVAFGHIDQAQARAVADSFSRVDVVLCAGDGEPGPGARVLACGRYGQRLAVADILFDRAADRVVEVQASLCNVEPAGAGPTDDSATTWNPLEYGIDEAGQVALGSLVAEMVRRGTGADLAVLPAYAVEPGLARGAVSTRELAAAAPFPDRLRLAVLHDTLVQRLADSVDQSGLAPFLAGADYFVTGDTARWPLAAQAARIRYRQAKHVFRVATTEQLLERAGITERGPVAGRLIQVWLAAATATDTLGPVALPRLFPASPGVVPLPGATAFPINLNTATAQLLEQLPGVGPKTAERIIAYRDEHGRFGAVDELMNIRGIGPKRMEQLRPLVSVR